MATTRSAAGTKRVLVVEDDQDIAQLIALHLRDEGYEVTVCSDGADALVKANSGDFDLLVLDLMLPTIDGIEICRRLRAQPDYLPIVMLTARGAETDRIVGLEMGADDYISKPFSVRELTARVRALFRRIEALGSEPNERDSGQIIADDLVIVLDKRRVTIGGQPISLTATEFELLVQFASNPGRVYSRSQLLELVWGYSNDAYQHTVNAHINRLRTKIEPDPRKPHYIQTVWGVGYKFRDNDS